ncbi:glutathione peroxidase [Chitinolyticbacter meiyuanensis]|uniref:glutathione peroxidase n=1 Tax=Chitinolyticbacter meiyuanensis TaxID=682798 RepID=UPI0011E5B1A8|nr:glutathione peroxidase [Chitinolyticbacter meiyuanensis]
MLRLLSIAVLLFLSQTALATCPPLLNSQFKTLQGEPFDLCQHAGKPILVVNTASKCGFTPQFEKLETLYRKYQDKGLLVVGFPSNDFKQELATNKEIGEFCKLTYLVQFPMMEASSVIGSNANPLFQRLAAASGTAPKWNFYKYLIAPDGKTVTAFASRVAPDDPRIVSAIEGWLKR